MSKAWIAGLLAAVLATGLAALLAATAMANERDSAFVTGGGGAEAIVRDARDQGLDVQRLVASPTTLGSDPDLDPARTLVVVAGPPTPYSQAERDAVERFVRQGGRLLVADDFGHAGSLTAPFGLAFERVRLVEAEAAPPEAILDGRTHQLGLSSPTSLVLLPGTTATVLAQSSATSFLDRDGDGVIAPGDLHGPFPLVAQVAHGDGIVLAVADVHPFTAAGTTQAQNAAWRQALLQHLLPEGGTVLVEESRLPSDPLLEGVALARSAASSPVARIAFFAVAAVLAATLLIAHLGDRWAPHRFRPLRFVRRGAAPATQPDGGPPVHTQWTQRGVAAIAAGAALAVLALATGSREAGYASAVLLVAVGWAAIPRGALVSAHRQVGADRVDENDDVRVVLRLAGRRRRQVAELEFRDRLPEEIEVRQGTNWFRAAVPAGRPLEVSYLASPAVRGLHALGPLQSRQEDLLGLRVTERLVAPPAQLRVNPRREDVRRLPFGTRVPTVTLGPHYVNRAGDGSEFHSLRPYQSGDSLRAVNWKASARSKGLMVNQRVHESLTRLIVFLDARAVAAAGPSAESPVAQGCRAVLSIATGALRMRDRVRVVVYGDGVHELPPLPASRLLHELTTLLSTVPAAGSTSFDDAVRAVLPSLRPGSPVMLASGLEGDPGLAEGARRLRARGLNLFVVAARIGTVPVDPEDGGPEPEAARLGAEREAGVAALVSLGIPVFDAPAKVPLDYLFRTGGAR